MLDQANDAQLSTMVAEQVCEFFHIMFRQLILMS